MKKKTFRFKLSDGTESDHHFLLTDTKFELADGQAKEGSIWDVTIIKEGKSKAKPNYYFPMAVLTKAAPLFEGVQVFAHRGGAHVAADTKSVHDEVGWLDTVVAMGSELKAKLHILPSASWIRQNLLTAWGKGKKNLYELSIDAGGHADQREVNGEMLPVADSIEFVDSVDIVPRGAAGGQFNRMIQADSKQSHIHITKGNPVMKQKLMTLFLLAFPTYLVEKGVDLAKVDENELLTHLLQADKASPRLHLPDGFQLNDQNLDKALNDFKASMKDEGDDQSLVKFQEAIDAMMKKIQAPNDDRMNAVELKLSAATLRATLAESKLPKVLADEVQAQFEGKIFQEADLKKAIDRTREVYSKFTQANPTSAIVDVQAGQDEFDKFSLALDGFFLTNQNGAKPIVLGSPEAKEVLKDVTPIRSIKEAYIHFTGDHDVSGKKSVVNRFSQSLQTTDWANVLAASLNRRMVRDYSALNLDTWRVFTDVVPITDFKQQERVRYGGYPNLNIVGQRNPYAPLSSPTDEKATYTPAKRGGTEDITREMIKNDDVGAIQRIPQRMARAAAQTLHEFVFDFVNPAVNPTIYDAVALYAAGHSNTATAALAEDKLFDARLRMKKQTMKNNSKRIGIRGRYLLVPSDLEQTAYGLLTPAFAQTNATPDFLQQVGIMPIVVDYWTDATDWALVADRMDVVGLEVGFMDGRTEPEMFVSDMANVGSWFTNDVITFKIRHEYGGAVIDYRAFDGSIVA